MYFDFEGRRFDTPTIESAMSWREQSLLSLFAHLAVVLIVLLFPRLPFVQEAEARRAEHLAELAELQSKASRQAREADNRRFVFIEPRMDLDAIESPRTDAIFSDRDRIAQSPRRAEDPENRLPIAEGNSLEFVEPDNPGDGLTESDLIGVLAGGDVPKPPDVQFADVPEPQLDARELAERAGEPGGERESYDVAVPDFAGPTLSMPDVKLGGSGLRGSSGDLPAEGLLDQAVQDMERYARQENFANLRGDTDKYGPSIQFDSKGVEFGPWIRRFVAQLRRNWFVPYAALTMRGHVVLTFFVHDDGTMSDLRIVDPSSTQAFNHSAFNALLSSNPTQPLPPEYPDDRVFFTVTFYFNETPPA